MAVPLVVPDASVLLKWVLPSEDEPDADKALQLRAAIVADTVHAIVPPLWIYEVGNTVARRFPVHAQTWLSALLRFGLVGRRKHRGIDSTTSARFMQSIARWIAPPAAGGRARTLHREAAWSLKLR